MRPFTRDVLTIQELGGPTNECQPRSHPVQFYRLKSRSSTWATPKVGATRGASEPLRPSRRKRARSSIDLCVLPFSSTTKSVLLRYLSMVNYNIFRVSNSNPPRTTRHGALAPAGRGNTQTGRDHDCGPLGLVEITIVMGNPMSMRCRTKMPRLALRIGSSSELSILAVK